MVQCGIHLQKFTVTGLTHKPFIIFLKDAVTFPVNYMMKIALLSAPQTVELQVTETVNVLTFLQKELTKN